MGKKGTKALGRKKQTTAKLKDPSQFKQGAALAKAAITRRTSASRSAAAAAAGQSLGFLIAEGDSWFDYPFFDVLEMLEQDGFEIESVAHLGDNLEDMAHDEHQIDRLAKAFGKYRQRGLDPKAVLLSGGGNDIAGSEFPVLLNHANSALPTLNDGVVTGLIDQRLRPAMASLIGTVTTFCRNFFGGIRPIVLHGYSYPVPDGRGYLGGAWILPGPWLEPGFRRKGYYARSSSQESQQLATNTKVVMQLIDRYNTMLQSVASSFPHVRYIDLRRVLSNELPHRKYHKDWGNELHPTKSGFRKVADEFAKVL